MTKDKWTAKAREIVRTYGVLKFQNSPFGPSDTGYIPEDTSLSLISEIAKALREASESNVVNEEKVEELTQSYFEGPAYYNINMAGGFKAGFREASRRNAIQKLEERWPTMEQVNEYRKSHQEKDSFYMVDFLAWLKEKVLGEK